MGLWLPTEEEMEEWYKGVKSLSYGLHGYCNRPVGGRCAVKACMKSLGYNNVKIYAEQDNHVLSKQKNNRAKTGHLSIAYLDNFDCYHSVLITNKEEAQRFNKLTSKRMDEIFTATNACCAKCKYYKSR